MKNTTDWAVASKNTSDWAAPSKITSGWSGNTTFDSAVLLSSTTVALNSTTVTLLGYAEGTHFFDTRVNTDWGGATKITTDWGSSTKNTTEWNPEFVSGLLLTEAGDTLVTEASEGMLYTQ